MDVDVEIEARAEDVFAEEALCFCLLDRFPNNLRSLRKFAADVDIGEVNVCGDGSDGEALEELVRILVEDVAILERARLRLITIDNDIVGFAIVVLDEAPLRSGREAGAAASAKVGRLDHVNDLARLHADSFFQGLVAAMGKVGLDIRGVAGFGNVAEDNTAFFRMRCGKQGNHGLFVLVDDGGYVGRFDVFDEVVVDKCHGGTTATGKAFHKLDTE